jgi:hypothetical protein
LHNPDPLKVKHGEVKSVKSDCSSKPSDISLWFSSDEKAAEFHEWLRYWGKVKPFDTTVIRIGCYELYWAGETFTYRTAHIFDFAEIRKF